MAGATGSTYTLADADEGKAIAVQVSFTDDAGNDETLTSAATETVSFAVQPQVANSPATGAPTISGTVQVGETLTADTSGIADENGLENLTFTYQWLADDDAIAGATDSTYTLADADEGKAIKVQVSFTDDAGNDETLTSAATDAVAAPEPPASPTGLSATASHDSVTLSWDDPGDDSITGYVILRRNRDIHAEGEFTNLVKDTGAAATTYTDDSVAAETPYTYRIKAINEHGESERSRWFHIDTPAAPDPADLALAEPPASPTGLAAEVSHDSVTLTWDDPGDDSITGYVILRRDSAIHEEGTFETVESDTGSAETAYTDDSAQPERKYVYRIKAINEHGLSEISSWVRAYTPAAPVPAAPTGLSASASHDSVTLTWDDPGDDSITGYVILRRNRDIDAKGEFTTLVEDTGATATTYTDDTVEPETPYTYRVKAINEHGESERSRWFHIDTPAAPLLAAPTGVGVAVSSDTVMLIWANPQDDSITGYRILRRDGDAQAGGEFTTIESDTGSAATTYADDTVEPERFYVYRVLAISPQGVSEPSRDVEVSTAAPVAPPEPLRSLRAHAGSTLLTNLGQDGKEGDALTAGADDLALGFTTGSNAGGYNLSGVRLDLAEVPVSPEDVSVELWSATGGATPAPQARIATLTHSTGTLVTGENTFYAPAGTTLQAGTIYFVFLSYGGSSATGFDLGITESTSADASSAPGWSLGQLFSRTRTPTGTWSASSGTLLVKFGILGGEPIEARLEPGDSASGTFDTQNTWYYFALDGLTPGRYTVSFSKGGIDAIYAPGNLITDQPREAATYTFDVRPDTTQTRYVSLRVWSDAGSYTASLDETMPDLVVGGPPVDGEIPKSSDRLGGPWGASMQLFPVELEAGVVYQVDIKGVDTDDGTMDYPMLANIAAPDGSYVGGTTHLFVQGGGEGRNVRYVFTADQDGMYFLKAGGALWKVYAVNGDSEGSRYRAGTFTVSIQETEEAPSCTLNRGDLWCGVVTVGSGSDVDGYDRGTGDDIGDLSDTDFDVGPNSYTIVGIFVDGFTADVPGTLSLVLHSNTRLSAADRDTLVLQVGGRSDSFALSDALVVAGRNVSWFSAGLDWSEEDYVIVRLREK